MDNSDLAIVFKNKYLNDLFKYMYDMEEGRILIFRSFMQCSIFINTENDTFIKWNNIESIISKNGINIINIMKEFLMKLPDEDLLYIKCSINQSNGETFGSYIDNEIGLKLKYNIQYNYINI